MTDISFRNADSKADYEFARHVHHAAYRDVVTRQFGSWDESLQDDFFKEGWERAPHTIILVDGKPAGVYSIAVHADHIFFSELQILPEFQGQGLGTNMVKIQIQNAESLGLPIRLQVLRENKAQKLYSRLGFKVTGTTEIHVSMEWKG